MTLEVQHSQNRTRKHQGTRPFDFPTLREFERTLYDQAVCPDAKWHPSEHRSHLVAVRATVVKLDRDFLVAFELAVMGYALPLDSVLSSLEQEQHDVSAC